MAAMSGKFWQISGVLALLVVMSGCSGGGGLVIGAITGPDAVSGQTTVQYSITAKGDTGFEYQWAIDPAWIGTITQNNTASVMIEFYYVQSDMDVQVSVVIMSDNSGPVIRTRKVVLRNVEDGELIVSEIQGAGMIPEYTSSDYSVTVSGSPWVSYEWSCDPSDAGIILNGNTNEISFRPYGVESDTKVELWVTVSAGDSDSSERIMQVVVGDDYNPGEYLGSGHPIEGVNFARNNRSTHALPQSLAGGESLVPPFNVEPYLSSVEFERTQDAVLTSDEMLYYSMHYWKGAEMYVMRYDNYSILSIYFGDLIGERYDGGKVLAAHSEGLVTISSHYIEDPISGHGDYYGYGWTDVYLHNYSPWPDLLASVKESWGWHHLYGDTGDWETARRFYDVFFLPDDRIIPAFTRALSNDEGLNSFVQILSSTFDELAEISFTGLVTGFTFDEHTGNTYISTEEGLYSYYWEFNEFWNTLDSCDRFAADIPVLADNGNVLGCYNGVLRSYNLNGELIAEAGGTTYLRPALLNDGTIVTLSFSTIMFLNENLELVDSIPLPAGSTTGDTYTRPPLVDAYDRLALFTGPNLFIIDHYGTVLAQRTFESDIVEIRLGPNHLYVLLDYEIFRFPS